MRVALFLAALAVAAIGCDGSGQPDWLAERDCGVFDVGGLLNTPRSIERDDPAHAGIQCFSNSHLRGEPARLRLSYKNGRDLVKERYRTRNGRVHVQVDWSGPNIDRIGAQYRHASDTCRFVAITSRGLPQALRCSHGTIPGATRDT